MWCEACQLKPADVAGTDKNLKFKGEGQVTQKYGSNLHVPPGWQSFMPTHVVSYQVVPSGLWADKIYLLQIKNQGITNDEF